MEEANLWTVRALLNPRIGSYAGVVSLVLPVPRATGIFL